MSDEAIVEIIAEIVARREPDYAEVIARNALVLLRSKGYEIYRPEDYPTAQQLTGRREDAAYLLVPVPVESEEG